MQDQAIGRRSTNQLTFGVAGSTTPVVVPANPRRLAVALASLGPGAVYGVAGVPDPAACWGVVGRNDFCPQILWRATEWGQLVTGPLYVYNLNGGGANVGIVEVIADGPLDAAIQKERL